jgi:membrane protease YdiL (CAAX protease family)
VGGHPPTSATLFLVATNTLAAVAEEAWFRRLWFGLLAPAGDGVAIAGSTILFAAVHVSIYGFWVLPLDLAAGLLFAWQRSTTGSWAAPAVTHVVANLLVVL